MNIFKITYYILEEKISLRNYQGKSRLNNYSNTKRNEEFYKKIEKRFTPILEKHNYLKKRKRLFIKNLDNSTDYINFGLTNNRNGICIDYGNIINKKIEKDKKAKLDSYNIDNKSKRLKPNFWKFDYQYPVRKSDKLDSKILDEIESLLFPILESEK